MNNEWCETVDIMVHCEKNTTSLWMWTLFFCDKLKLWCEWIWLKWIKDVDDHGGCSRMIDNGKMVIFLRHPVVRVGRGLNTWHNGGVHGSQCYTNQ